MEGIEPQGSEIARIIEAVRQGEESAVDELLPAAYQELRRIAGHLMSIEQDGHTLQATELVHEGYLRMFGPDPKSVTWNSKGHFFSAASEAMRRVLVDHARRKKTRKRGGEDAVRVSLTESGEISSGEESESHVLMIDEALNGLEEKDQQTAEVVKLRYFVGLSVNETACVMDVSPSKVDRLWRAGRAWLQVELSDLRK